MAEIHISIKNIDAIKAEFKKKPALISQRLDTAVNKVITKIEADAKKEAPVNKSPGIVGGTLRQSIRSGMTGLSRGYVEVQANYGIFVHEGTRPHTIKVVNRKVLANKRTGQVFGRVVQHPGTKANPFLIRAIEKNQTWIDKTFEEVIAFPNP